MFSKIPQARPFRSGPTSAVQSDRVRIARSLIGETPEGSAAFVGRSSDTPSIRQASSPIPKASEVSTAIRLIMGCYQDTGFAEHQPTGAGPRNTSGSGAVVQEYIALRSAWENRKARSLATWMTEHNHAGAGNVAATTASLKIEQAPAEPAGRQRILVVDDSPDILIIAGAFLNDFGFDVVHAANADAALVVLADGAPIDLLMTDYAMPGMNGIDLVVLARERNPRQRALIITGYADSSTLTELPEGVAVLAKPFRSADLYKCILSIVEPSVRAEGVATKTHESVSAR